MKKNWRGWMSIVLRLVTHASAHFRRIFSIAQFKFECGYTGRHTNQTNKCRQTKNLLSIQFLSDLVFYLRKKLMLNSGSGLKLITTRSTSVMVPFQHVFNKSDRLPLCPFYWQYWYTDHWPAGRTSSGIKRKKALNGSGLTCENLLPTSWFLINHWVFLKFFMISQPSSFSSWPVR